MILHPSNNQAHGKSCNYQEHMPKGQCELNQVSWNHQGYQVEVNNMCQENFP